jgi:GNAT superfamily N-acetyltransferase
MPIGTDMGWNIQQISKDTIKDIETLYLAVYGRKPATNNYQHKFLTGYTGVEYSGFIAYSEEGRPVASLCIIPSFISYEGNRLLAAQLVDGMTDPAFRKRGLAGLLEDEINAFAKENKFQVLFTFPNEEAYPVWTRKGWRMTEMMERFMIPVPRTMKWYISSLMKRSLGKKVPGIEQEDCHNSVFADGFAGIDRSKEYFQYKSFTYTKVLVNNGDKAWIKSGHNLAIGDMEVTEDGFDAILKKIKAIAQQTGARKLFFQSSKGTGLHRLFSQRYKAEPSFPVLFKVFEEGVEVEKIRFTFADLDIF